MLPGTLLGRREQVEAGRRPGTCPFLSAFHSRRLGQLCGDRRTGGPASQPWVRELLALQLPHWPGMKPSGPPERPAQHPAPRRGHWPRRCPVLRPASEETQGLGQGPRLRYGVRDILCHLKESGPDSLPPTSQNLVAFSTGSPLCSVLCSCLFLCRFIFPGFSFPLTPSLLLHPPLCISPFGT